MKLRLRTPSSRRGTALVLLMISLVTLLTFVALAIDLGVLAIARTQCQDAADAAAMAGARTLNGVASSNSNYSLATPNAVQAATRNSVLGKNFQSGQVAIDIGRYVYVGSNQRFEGQFPGPTDENWSMVRARVQVDLRRQLPFARVFNTTAGNVQAEAVAAHRPRDVAIILDYSGSMRFASLAGVPYTGSSRSSNNPDAVVPQFGHYASTGSAGLQASSFSAPYDPANITATTSDGRLPIVKDFYSSDAGALAFSPAPNSYATTPGGDNYLKVNSNTGTSYCTHVKDLLNLSSVSTSTPKHAFETNGYDGISGASPFRGYTQGPGYWGKTFFVWPPDPRPSKDWRVVYFGTNDNSQLWDSSGNWKVPSSSSYSINYTAILNFIKNIGPNPFPSRLQSGRILYYDAIPSSISSTYPPSNLNERFWKDYIDYVLGLMQTGSNSWTQITGYSGYGGDFTAGTVKITAMSSLTAYPKPYMHYQDNPKRPKTHFWFGPLTMIDFLGNYNLWSVVNPDYSRYCWWPGTCHEAPMYACKLGIRAALSDISNNHPNDLVSLIMFSHPRDSASGDGRFNRVRVGLSRRYADMQESLWYPPSTIGNSSARVRPYDADNIEVPRACGGTCYSMGLMLAYNQFSANTTLLNYNPGAPQGDAGGKGRRGAQKIVIIETDGSPTTAASAAFVNQGPHNSYYRVRYNSSNPSSSEYPSVNSGASSSSVMSEISALCNQLCALDTAGVPGYSTPSKRVQIHCIGFGPEFSPSGPNRANNIATLNQIQTIGNVTDGMPSYKIIYGPENTVINNLQQAFTQILQSGVQVSLIH